MVERLFLLFFICVITIGSVYPSPLVPFNACPTRCHFVRDFFKGHGGTVLGLESLTIAGGVVCEEFVSGVAQTLWIIAHGSLKETRSEICNVRLAQRERKEREKSAGSSSLRISSKERRMAFPVTFQRGTRVPPPLHVRLDNIHCLFPPLCPPSSSASSPTRADWLPPSGCETTG